MDSFFLLIIVLIYLFIYLFKNRLPEVPEYAKMQFHMITLLGVLYSQRKISDIYLSGVQENEVKTVTKWTVNSKKELEKCGQK